RPAPAKSSIVFLRSSEPAGTSPGARPAPPTVFEETSLLSPGTRLVARLESAATTALKTPVVASIEYNYERDGIVMVPAGTKVFGDLQEASSEGVCQRPVSHAGNARWQGRKDR